MLIGVKVGGVKKLNLLAIVPAVIEDHHNMQILSNLIIVDDISFLYVADFKLLLITIGKQTSRAMQPCAYCDATRDDIRYFSSHKYMHRSNSLT